MSGLDIDEATLLRASKDNIFELLTSDMDEFINLDLDLLYIALPINAALSAMEQLSGVDYLITDSCSTK